ncbi:ribonuclease E/G, partial [Staphylococcus aureus]
ERMLERDHAKTKITQVSELGLVEMTRKRTRESLEHLLCESCPTCQGRGYVKTAESVCYEIFREILRYARAYESQSGF